MTAGFGVFGKVPAIGDFLRLNLSPSFVQAWDAWLQTGLSSLKDALGASWDAHYLSAPIWRFTLPAGHAGKDAICGVLMASVDRVGRQYPLTLVSPVSASSPAALHFTNAELFLHLENVALSALEDDYSVEKLTHALAELQVQTPQPAVLEGGRYVGQQDPSAALSAYLLDQTHGGSGIWSTVVEKDHRMLLCTEIPNRVEFAALFDLNASLWQRTSVP